MRGKRCKFVLAVILAACIQAGAEVPSLIPYQGRVVVNGTNFDGVAQFKFSIINQGGTACYWANDGSSGIEPVQAVSLNVWHGLFSLMLGDTNLVNMVSLPSSVFTNANLRLRVWFNPGSGFEQLSPDHTLGSVAYAMLSASVEDEAIKPSMLAPETLAIFVPVSGGVMTGALTNQAGFYGNGIGITNLQPGAYQETDPLFAGSVAACITSVHTGQWTVSYLWGNHSTAGYLRAVSNLAEVADAAGARANLGLGTLAIQDAANIAVTGGTIANVSLAVKSNPLIFSEGRFGIGEGAGEDG